MKTRHYTLAFSLFILVAFVFVLGTIQVSASDVTSPSAGGSGANCGSQAVTTGIPNPICSSSIQAFVGDVMTIILEILSVAAVLYILWAGFLFVKARGNKEELADAKRALLHALIGTGIILGAWTLASIIANTVNQVTRSQNVSLPKN